MIRKLAPALISAALLIVPLFASAQSVGVSGLQTELNTLLQQLSKIQAEIASSSMSSDSSTTSPSISVSIFPSTVAQDGTLHLSWQTQNDPRNTIAWLYLVNTSGKNYGVIPGNYDSQTGGNTLPNTTTGSGTWTIPPSCSAAACFQPAGSDSVFTTDPGTYVVVADLITPADACAGDCPVLTDGPMQVLAQATSTPFTVTATSSSPCLSFSGNLGLGSTGTFVSELQQFLDQLGLLSSQPTGYFGSLTQQGVEEWQSQNGVVSSGSPSTTGFGAVGPRTRAAMGAQCGGGSTNNPPVVATSSPTSALTATPSSGGAPLAVSFGISGFSGPDELDFGDGSTTSVPVGSCSATLGGTSSCQLRAVSHTYASTGTYTALLTQTTGGMECPALNYNPNNPFSFIGSGNECTVQPTTTSLLGKATIKVSASSSASSLSINSFNAASSVGYDQPTTVSWSVSGMGPNDYCIINPASAFAINGDPSHPGVQGSSWSSTDYATVPLTATTTLSLNCGSVSKSLTVAVNGSAPAPSCTISLNSSTISSGGSATLTYTMQNGTLLDIAGVGFSGASSGSTTVSPLVTSTYYGTVTGPGGTGQCSALLTIAPSQ